MDMFRISGGVPLAGCVEVSGSKNAALPIMAASILAEDAVWLEHVPQLVDVNTLSLVLGTLGVEVKRQLDGRLRITTIDPEPTRADYELVRRMRASFCVLGPLLARRGQATVSLPGGCNIGDRPVDLHLKGLAALGADVRIEHGYVVARVPHGRLRGAEVHLSGPRGSTVTGTANVMMAAILAQGLTILTGIATEPEIVDLGDFLNSLGAQITGLGTSTLEIRGVEQLTGGTYRVIPDRIEAATLLIAIAITGGSATIAGVIPEHLTAILQTLHDAGHRVAVDADRITLESCGTPLPTDITALPYPGVPTDVQSQFMALAAVGSGRSMIRDLVFGDRFLHVAELNRLGASIERHGPTAVVTGVRRLTGAPVMASDLRASAALVLAGLAAEGQTLVRRIYHLDRGYERLEEKLNRLGARVERIRDDATPLIRADHAQRSSPVHLRV
jgi:UDP-N-acetylglucosamine 1-carboxyvinyltransferase